MQRAIKNEIDPNLDTWSTYRGTLMSTRPYEQYAEACRKANKACNMSELSTSEEIDLPPKRVIKKKHVSDFESDTSDSEESLRNVPAPPRISDVPSQNCLRKSQKENAKSSSAYRPSALSPNNEKENVKPAVAGKNLKTGKETGPIAVISSREQKDLDEHTLNNVDEGNGLLGESQFKQIICAVIKQNKILKDHEQKLDSISSCLDEVKVLLCRILESNVVAETHDKQICEIFQDLPITSIEELEKVENQLEDKNVRDKFVNDLRRLGGDSYRECARRFLKKIMLDELAKGFSLHGHKGKKIFAKTNLFVAVTEAILQCDKTCNTKSIEVAIGQWLAKAPDRQKTRKGQNDVVVVQNN